MMSGGSVKPGLGLYFTISVWVVAVGSTTQAQTADLEWSQYYFSGSTSDCWDMIETADGGFALVGSKLVSSGDSDIYLLKTNSTGDVNWIQTYGDSGIDTGHSVKQTSDGGYIITGSLERIESGYTDLCLIRTDSMGDTIWTRTYGGSYNDEGRCVDIAVDGGYISAGWTDSGSNDDFYLLRVDAYGDSIWSGTFGYYVGDNRAWSVKSMPSGRFAVLGWSSATGMYFVLTNWRGDLVASKFYGDSNAEGRDIIISPYTQYEGHILCGRFSPNNSSHVALLRTTAMGFVMWQRTIGTGLMGQCVDLTSEGGYVIGAYSLGSHDRTYVFKTNPEGQLRWADTLITGSNTFVRAIHETGDQMYAVAGCNSSSSFLLKLSDNSTGISAPSNDPPSDFSLDQNYPNPFNAVTNIDFDLKTESQISLRVFNIRAEVVAAVIEGYYKAGIYSVPWDASGLASGIYFARLTSKNGSRNIKMLLLK